MTQLQLIKPREAVGDPRGDDASREEEYVYRIMGLANDSVDADSISVRLVSHPGGEELDAEWALDNVQPGPESLVGRWAALRAREWVRVSGATRSPVLDIWLNRMSQLYGTEDMSSRNRAGRRNRGRSTSVFNVLGGRAAIRETLQMQEIGSDESDGEAAIPVSEIAGVEVKSHPFDEMLGEDAGGRLPLADFVPVDRFMLHVRKPAALTPLLEDGGAFADTLGMLATGHSLDRDLRGRYLARLGMDEQWLKSVLESGAMAELALILPDLFVADGTDITIVARVPRLALLKPLLRALGVGELGASPVARQNPDGSTSYWAATGEHLLIGTHRGELEAVLEIGANPTPETSLGRSAEFRYMLTKLPQNKSTRMYAYFSDPFIRRLVGPSVKIGQLRRLKERATLEGITAGGLLYRLDGHTGVPSVSELAEKGYVPEQLKGEGFTVNEDLSAVSPRYGMLADMSTIAEHPVEKCTEKEAEMYGEYVQAYSRFWRQFFDPIAIRLDDNDGQLALSTFILPLLDSAIYRQLRESLPDLEDGGPLRIPQLDPEPVFGFSLALTDEVWQSVAQNFLRMFTRQLGIKPSAFDMLGPSIHFAVRDGDPVLALGGGDLLGAFGSAGGFGFQRAEMVMIPMLFTALTRPAALFVEMQKPEAVRTLLRQGLQSTGGRGRGDDIQTELYRVGDRDEWVYAVDIAGFVKLRFGLSMVDQYLVITNLPWSQKIDVDSVEPAPMNAAAIRLFPANVKQQLPALYSAAAEQRRKAAFEGIGYLYPLTLLPNVSSAEDALRKHQTLFGFRPVHPGDGQWTLEREVPRSSAYGSLARRRQPAYEPGNDDFGLFGAVEQLFLNMQFEDDGLRSLLKWSVRK
ncbi:MAG: hypothetical protein ACOCWJ_00315 [Verrucomicrobiota bacterium]